MGAYRLCLLNSRNRNWIHLGSNPSVPVMNNDNIKTLYIRCDCRNLDDLVVMEYDENDFKDRCYEMTFDYRLNHFQPWYKRIWIAFKYIFKRSHSNFHFSEIILNRQTIRRIHEFTGEFLNNS